MPAKTVMNKDAKIVLTNQLNMMLSPERSPNRLLPNETLAHRDDMRASFGGVAAYVGTSLNGRQNDCCQTCRNGHAKQELNQRETRISGFHFCLLSKTVRIRTVKAGAVIARERGENRRLFG